MVHFISTKERRPVADTVARQVRTATWIPSRERTERQFIVGTILDPNLGIVDDVVDRARPDGSLERELRVDDLTDALYRKLASITGEGFTLRVLADAGHVNLAHAYVAKAMRGGWRRCAETANDAT